MQNNFYIQLSFFCTHFYFKDVHVSSLQEFDVALCHPGYVLEGEVCVCNDSHPDIYRCDGYFRYIYIRVSQQHAAANSSCRRLTMYIINIITTAAAIY